ncbi:TadE/TadG family type IV pilus assembly protein [Limnohabitans sp. 2KL-3]|uniref:TadE/TadG family type IV pilus assembly protein n=1 Tax=Limnohabitans sp. 2KL-3 TaxID=1100700 RepID=UPI000B2ECC15|nr:TadE/TadG family type IV pilus assembly protein [Limnohabitans sp. 2KL-3]
MKYLLNKQKGLILIEFTLSFIIFWIIFIAIIEFGRAMLAWNAASEATRLSARVASICTKASKSAITNKTLNLLQLTGQVFYIDEIDQDGDGIKEIIKIDMSHDDLAYDGSTDWLKLDYSPIGCGNGNCESVRASLSKLYIIFGIAGFTYKIPLPSSSITVLREGMSTLNKFNTDNLNNFCR